MDSLPPDAARGRRGLALLTSVLLLAAAQCAFTWRRDEPLGWWLALAAVGSAAVWQDRLRIVDWRHATGAQWRYTTQPLRRFLGWSVAAVGVALWLYATWALAASWSAGYTTGWVLWALGAAVMVSGLRVLQVRRPGTGERLRAWEWGVLGAAVLVAAAFRLANFDDFPPETGIAQIEELQAGQFGDDLLRGERARWEFIGQAWLAALSLTFGGRSIYSVRIAYSIIAFLKVVPAYFLFRSLAGPVGAAAGSALLAVSAWDTIANRIPGQHDQFVVMLCFALVAGPLVRGAWFVLPMVGVAAGYTIYTYVAYRPLLGFVLAGAAIAALARQDGGCRMRAVRVVGTLSVLLALLVAMFVPLTQRLSEPGQFDFEYLNGWNRARAISAYYAPDDTWPAALTKRWQRTQSALALFFTRGDTNPTRNIEGRPLVDAATGSLAVLGVGYCVWMCWSGFYGLILAFFAVTLVGTLIATGNFDVLRCASAIPHAFALVAVGTGSLWTAAHASFRRRGRVALGVLLVAGVAWAAYWNARLLHDLWASPRVRVAYRSDLAYLLGWLGRNAANQRAVALIPYPAYTVFSHRDGAWLLGAGKDGLARFDFATTVAALARTPGPAVLALYFDENSRRADIVDYIGTVLPGVTLDVGPADPTGFVPLVFARLSAPGALLAGNDWRERVCRGADAQFEAIGADGKTLASFDRVVPYIDRHTYPAAVREFASGNAGRLARIRANWSGQFTTTETGVYGFLADAYDGSVSFAIDGRDYASGQKVEVRLDPGVHRVTMHGDFSPRAMEPTARLWWQPPGASDGLRALPFYRFTDADPACVAEVSSAAATGSGG